MRVRAAMRRAALAAIAAALCLPGGSSAEPARAASPAPAPSCQAADETAEVTALAAVIETLRRSAAQREPDARRVQALDNRGYNYALPGDPLAEPLPQPPHSAP